MQLFRGEETLLVMRSSRNTSMHYVYRIQNFSMFTRVVHIVDTEVYRGYSLSLYVEAIPITGRKGL